MSPLLQQVLVQLAQLSPDEQLEVIVFTAKQLQQRATSKLQRHWRDLKGKAPYPLMGSDAQTWVTQARREDDDRRERGLRGLA